MTDAPKETTREIWLKISDAPFDVAAYRASREGAVRYLRADKVLEDMRRLYEVAVKYGTVIDGMPACDLVDDACGRVVADIAREYPELFA